VPPRKGGQCLHRTLSACFFLECPAHKRSLFFLKLLFVPWFAAAAAAQLLLTLLKLLKLLTLLLLLSLF